MTIDDKTKENIYILHDCGVSNIKISKMLNISKPTVCRYLKDIGYKPINSNFKPVPVSMIDKNTNLKIRDFKSINEAYRYLNIPKGHIHEVIDSKYTAHGYKWKRIK